MWKVAFLVFVAVSAVSSSMPGGYQDVNPNDEGVKNALNFAVVQHNRVSNDLYLSQVAEVVKVQSQVGKRPQNLTITHKLNIIHCVFIPGALTIKQPADLVLYKGKANKSRLVNLHWLHLHSHRNFYSANLDSAIKVHNQNK